MNILEGLQSVSNIHPIIVHFPIGLLIISTLFFIAGHFIKPNNELIITGKWTLIMGSLFALLAVITGLLAASTLPHDEEIHHAMTIHRNILIPVMIIALSLAGYIFFQKDLSNIKRGNLFLSGLIIMSGLLVLGADYGGQMVFKYGAGTALYEKLNPETEDEHNHQHGDHEQETDKHHNEQ